MRQSEKSKAEEDCVDVLMRRGGGPWKRPESDRYDDEAALQCLLVDTPDLLPGVGPAVAVAEFPLPSGSVDVVVVEPGGEITVVECKLGHNREARRAVVGQVLSYASRMSLLDVEEFEERFSAGGEPLPDRLASMCAEVGIEWDPERYRATLATRLADGPMRVIVAVDRLSDELRTIIEFLNRRTTGGLEVLALEMEIAQDGEIEILLPRVYGEESIRSTALGRRTTGRRWTVDDVFERLEAEIDPEMVREVRRLTEGVLARGCKLYPGKAALPSFFAYGRLGGDDRSLFVITLEENRLGGPTIYLNVKSWSKSMPSRDVERLVASLSALPGLEWFEEAIAERGIGALHRARLDAVLRGGRFVDTLLAGLGPFLPEPR
jgi:hypothetical protein